MFTLNLINLSTAFSLLMIHSALIAYSPQLKAENLKTIGSVWNKCPSNYKDFQETLSDFEDKIKKHFSSKNSDEINEFYNQDHSESANLRLFAPFLVVPASQTHFDRQCWVIFKDFSNSLSGNNKTHAGVLRKQWISCLGHYYRKVPDEARKISNCYEALK